MTAATNKTQVEGFSTPSARLLRAAAASKVAKLRRMMADGDKVVAQRFRTKMCHHFVENGSCPYESRCMFAHGRNQLRTKDMNLRDGLVNEEAIRQFKRGMSLRPQEEDDDCFAASGASRNGSVTSVGGQSSPRSSASSPSTSPRSFPSHEGDSCRPSGNTIIGRRVPEPTLATGGADDESAVLRATLDCAAFQPHRSRWYQHNPYAWCAISPAFDPRT